MPSGNFKIALKMHMIQKSGNKIERKSQGSVVSFLWVALGLKKCGAAPAPLRGKKI